MRCKTIMRLVHSLAACIMGGVNVGAMNGAYEAIFLNDRRAICVRRVSQSRPCSRLFARRTDSVDLEHVEHIFSLTRGAKIFFPRPPRVAII